MDEKEAMKRAAEKDAIEDDEMLVFQSGWKAALKWRDSQAGEPVAYTNEFQLEYVKNQSIKQGLMWSTPGEESIPVYTAPPAAQTARPQFIAEGYMVVVNGQKMYFDTYAEAETYCDDNEKPAILYDILQKPTQTG